MGKTRKLRERLTTEIKTFCPRVFFEKAPSDAEYPFIVFNLEEFERDRNSRGFSLEINIWDKSDTSSEIEDLADEIESLFDDYKYMDENMFIYSYFELKNSLTDPEEILKRRRLVFDLVHYKRSDI